MSEWRTLKAEREYRGCLLRELAAAMGGGAMRKPDPRWAGARPPSGGEEVVIQIDGRWLMRGRRRPFLRRAFDWLACPVVSVAFALLAPIATALEEMGDDEA